GGAEGGGDRAAQSRGGGDGPDDGQAGGAGGRLVRDRAISRSRVWRTAGEGGGEPRRSRRHQRGTRGRSERPLPERVRPERIREPPRRPGAGEPPHLAGELVAGVQGRRGAQPG